MMLHPNTISSAMADPGRSRHSKRKAGGETPEGNERLSKRLSLLNLDNTGVKAYVAVPGSQDAPSAPSSYAPTTAAPTSALPVVLEESHHATAIPHISPVDPIITDAPEPTEPLQTPRKSHAKNAALPTQRNDDDMSVDDTKYKVYIHNIDAELADDEAEDSDNEAPNEATFEAVQARDGSGKLVFMPVVDKHLRAAARDAFARSSSGRHKLAVPRPIIPNKDGEIAGMQVILYRDPTSLTVPPEQDSVRQAILDTRARYRERRREEQQGRPKDELEVIDVTDGDDDVNDANDVNDVNDVNDDTSMTSTPAPGTPIASAEDAGFESDGMDLD